MPRPVLFKIFVFLVGYLAIAGWGLSGIHQLRWIGIASLPGVALAVLLARRWLPPGAPFWRGLREPLAYGPFLLVGGLVLLGHCLYPPTMLDSLTYRLPRLFLWLQHGDLFHFISSDDRMNCMPQTWGLITLPLVQLAADHLIWLWTFASWIVLYLLAYDWALELNGEVQKSRRMAFIASTSTFAVLQAASSATDLFAGVMTLLALRFVMNFERTRDWPEIHWAVWSFCMATGTKPHFSVFGLPLVVWFFASPAKPWRAFRWVWLPLLLPVWLLCSSLPSFVLNSQTYGSWAGPSQDASPAGPSRVWNCLLGTTLVGWQSLQPPVNPLASAALNHKIDEKVAESGWNKQVTRFNLRFHQVSIVDTAALGLVTSLLFFVGIFLALRRNPDAWCSWPLLALAAGFVAMELALSQFVSFNSGRVYAGFLYWGLPLALLGWNRMRPGTLKLAMYLSLGSSLIVILLYPSHPLWPARWIQQKLATSPRFHSAAEALATYLRYADRATTGEEIMQVIPAGESQVVLLVGEDRPLLPLMRPFYPNRLWRFLPAHAMPEELSLMGARYVVVGGGARVAYPELCDYLATSSDYEMVVQRDYTSKLERGPETWTLYCRKTFLPAPAPKPE